MKKIFILLCFFAASAASGQNGIRLPAIISDHMVLQQNTSVLIWGKAKQGSEIEISASWGESLNTTVLEDSTWKVSLNTPKAGGPYEIAFNSGGERKILKDILIGEVWLCSGQSNMEMPLEGWPPKDTVMNSKQEIAQADYPRIRLFTVMKMASLFAKTDCTGKWEACDSNSVKSFSAAGYFFGQKLFSDLGIPIGLIHSSWGGTPAESWTSGKYLSNLEEFNETLNNINDLLPSEKKLSNWLSNFPSVAVFDYDKNDLWNNIKLNDENLCLKNLDDSEWKTMTLPVNWEKTELGEFDGFIWFRKNIELPEKWIGKNLTIMLGAIDDYDVSYVNGKKIGAMENPRSWKLNRVYSVSREINNDKNLLVAVRVNDTGGQGGGIYGRGFEMKLILDETKEEISLVGDWKYLPVAELHEMKYYLFTGKTSKFSDRPRINLSLTQRTPTSLYNGMIAPLVPFKIKGVIWYQGESNTPDPMLYEKLFPELIKNWRADWGYNFPFYFVQIAPYRHGSVPGSQYLRDAQRKTLVLENTGMAVSLDAGDSTTVHPANKKIIGERLALWALAKQYGKKIVYSGPLYSGFKIVKSEIELSFDFADGGLILKKNRGSYQFEIAGEDKIFVPADVRVEGEKIYVFSDKIKIPAAVRYAWGNLSEATLFNKAGLPASSFRTDNW